MKKRPAWVWVAAIGSVGLLALVIGNVIQIATRPGDSEQIAQAIEEMRQASLKGKSGGVLEHMSRSFQLPAPYSEQTGSPLGDVSRWVRQAKIERLEITDVRPVVYGSTGVANAHVRANFQFLNFRFAYDGPVEFNFQKETHRRLIAIPEARWMLTSIGPLDSQYLRLD